MSDLESVERKLYTPGAVGTPAPSFLRRIFSRPADVKMVWGDESELGQSPVPMKKRHRSFFILLGALLVLLGAAAIAAIFYIGLQRQNLTVALLVKDRIESGERLTYQIAYKNEGNQILRDLELNFTYPPGAVPLRDDKTTANGSRVRLPLADLKPGEEAKIELAARLFGRQDEVKKAEGVFYYRIDQGSTRFSVAAGVETVIARVPLVVSINMPNEVVSGQTMTLVVDYTSSAQAPFEGLSLGLQYPSGFEFVLADPAPTKDNNIWSIGTLAPGDSGKITIRGVVSGPPADVKIFNVQVGLYDASNRVWTPYQVVTANAEVSTPLLSIEQRINESRDTIFKPGDQLNIRLHYKNMLDIPVRNIVVEVALAGDVADLQSLQIDDGVFDGSRNVIIWNSASFPNFSSLAPHAEGDLRFSVRIKPLASSEVASGKNIIVTSTARISSPDRPAGLEGVDLSSTDILTAKMSTRLVLSSRLLYHNQYLSNTGPLPPKVKEKTTYTVLWQITNTTNDLTNVELHATLLPGATWENQVNPASQSVDFNANSGVITWRVGNIPAGAGLSRTGPMLAFNIGLVPGVDQIGKSPTLVRGIELIGVDAFTNEQVLIKSADLDTRLTADPTSTDSDWRVAQ